MKNEISLYKLLGNETLENGKRTVKVEVQEPKRFTEYLLYMVFYYLFNKNTSVDPGP